MWEVVVLLLLILGVISISAASNINPLPAKSAAARAYELFNLVTFTIGAKSVNTINVAMQLKDAHGQNIAQVAHLTVYLSDVATGAGLTATPTTSALAVGTNGSLVVIDVTGKIARFLTDASGRLDINLIQSASPVTEYLCVQMPDGTMVVSSAITW